ncbi:MAG: hypothetical protein H0U16_11640 [Actinobacteria bacterium]|nr:hypothetical protein [Actinomycetota bacterium]
MDPALGRVTLTDWVHMWLQGAGPTVKPKTRASYESLLRSRVLPVFGQRQLSNIRPSDVQAWVGEMQTSGLSASAGGHRAALRTRCCGAGQHVGTKPLRRCAATEAYAQ